MEEFIKLYVYEEDGFVTINNNNIQNCPIEELRDFIFNSGKMRTLDVELTFEDSNMKKFFSCGDFSNCTIRRVMLCIYGGDVSMILSAISRIPTLTNLEINLRNPTMILRHSQFDEINFQGLLKFTLKCKFGFDDSPMSFVQRHLAMNKLHTLEISDVKMSSAQAETLFKAIISNSSIKHFIFEECEECESHSQIMSDALITRRVPCRIDTHFYFTRSDVDKLLKSGIVESLKYACDCLGMIPGCSGYVSLYGQTWANSLEVRTSMSEIPKDVLSSAVEIYIDKTSCDIVSIINAIPNIEKIEISFLDAKKNPNIFAGLEPKHLSKLKLLNINQIAFHSVSVLRSLGTDYKKLIEMGWTPQLFNIGLISSAGDIIYENTVFGESLSVVMDSWNINNGYWISGYKNPDKYPVTCRNAKLHAMFRHACVVFMAAMKRKKPSLFPSAIVTWVSKYLYMQRGDLSLLGSLCQ